MRLSLITLACIPLILSDVSLVSSQKLSTRIPIPPEQCIIADSWPVGPGHNLVPQSPDRELRDILSGIDTRRVRQIIEKLVSFGTRHTLSSQTDPHRGIGAARDWIASEMRTIARASHGRMTVTVPSYVQVPVNRIPTNTVISDIVATLRGSSEPNRVYVLSGHYDSRNSDIMDFTNDSPGANDDASGVAVVMELARVMATRRPAATIVFAAVAGEEQGLFGANFLAQTLVDSGVDVQGMLNNDIVGSSTADDGVRDPSVIRQGMQSTDSASRISQRLSIGGENDTPARQLGRFVSEVSTNDVTKMSIEMIYRQDRFLRSGDHIPFLQRGIPAVRFTEPNEDFNHQHQDVRVEKGIQIGDLIEFVDFDFITRVAKVNGAALWSLANAPGTPKNVTMNESVLTNNSTITWALDPHATGGYEVVYRNPHEAFWTHAIPVGRTNTVTLKLSKDNVNFGVRAVGSNGFKSPATFPFPA
ncbi:hypothetical protein ONZ45_g4421 [Pleurotus djamor]|nr:hypothetical protein ONZ45_g4421 [Pleurotus djamor]